MGNNIWIVAGRDIVLGTSKQNLKQTFFLRTKSYQNEV